MVSKRGAAPRGHAARGRRASTSRQRDGHPQAQAGSGRARRRPVPDRDRLGADLGDAVQHADLGRLRQRDRHAGRLPGRADRARRCSASATWRWRARSPPPAGSTASSATGSTASSAWRPGFSWSPPTACSRSRWSAALPTSPRSRRRATGSTSAGTGGALRMIAVICVLAFFDVKLSARGSSASR